MPKPEGYRVTTNSTAGPATLNRPPGCGRLDLSAFVRSVGAFRHVLRRWPNHGFALDHLHRDWNSRHCHSWAADIRAEGDIAFLRQIDPLEQCPSSSSRCRERDIGDSTPPSPLLERGALASLFYAFGWIVAAIALWILVLPDGFRIFSRAIFNFFEPSGGDAVLRVIGLL